LFYRVDSRKTNVTGTIISLFKVPSLLKGTNDLLTQASQNPLLLAKNKFMIVHASREDKIAAGALPNLKNQRI